MHVLYVPMFWQAVSKETAKEEDAEHVMKICVLHDGAL